MTATVRQSDGRVVTDEDGATWHDELAREDADGAPAWASSIASTVLGVTATPTAALEAQAEDAPDDDDASILADVAELGFDTAKGVRPGRVATGPGASKAFWAGRTRVLPDGVVELIDGRVKADWVKGYIIAAAEAVLLAEVAPELRDPAFIEAVWDAAWMAHAEDLTAWLVRIRNGLVRGIHVGRCEDHKVFGKMPAVLRSWRRHGGVFEVNDERLIPSFGYPSFMEATPPIIVRWSFEVWMRTTCEKRLPAVWDLTGGSGTIHDMLGDLFSCRVVSTDLTPANKNVGQGDARDVGTHPGHGGPCIRLPGGRRPSPIPKPDLVFFDPPSRGTPSHAESYDGPWPDADLAVLDRADYVDVVEGITRRAVEALAPGGYLSFLLRHGGRERGLVEPDDRLLDDVRGRLDGNMKIVTVSPVRWGASIEQFSMGHQRVPATHLLLARAS